jgi:hypothetical protein
MFGRRETRDKAQWDEWSGDDSWSASNVESVASAKSPFSFFSFNLFESEEKFQAGSSNSDGSDDHDDDMEEKPQTSLFGLAWSREETEQVDRKQEIKSLTPTNKHDDFQDSSTYNADGSSTETESKPKGLFWRQGRKQNVLPNHGRNVRWDISEDVASSKPAPINLKTIRGYAKPKDLIQKHLLRNKNYDFRDDIEANSSRVSGQQQRESVVHPFFSGHPTFEDRGDGITANKKCFPSWPFKNRVSSPEELIVPEPEWKPVVFVPTSIEKVIRSTPTVKADEPPTGPSLAAKISATRKKAHSQRSSPYRFDVAEDDIWDDDTTSSGWFSLESLDGR